jgi:hypothetical protein
MKTLFGFFLFLSIVSSSTIFSQSVEENWVPVDKIESQSIFINTTGLKYFKEDDIYFWTLEKHDPPLIIESVDGKIYQTKTYYLVNKKLKKYSIMDIIYYDKNDNVLANYSYKRNMDNEKFKYNYPIMDDSQMSIIFNEVLKYIGE